MKLFDSFFSFLLTKKNHWFKKQQQCVRLNFSHFSLHPPKLDLQSIDSSHLHILCKNWIIQVKLWHSDFMVYVCACSNTLCGSVGVALHLVWHWAAKIRADPIRVSLPQCLPTHPPARTHALSATHSHKHLLQYPSVPLWSHFCNPDCLCIHILSHMQSESAKIHFSTCCTLARGLGKTKPKRDLWLTETAGPTKNLAKVAHLNKWDNKIEFSSK